VIGGVGRSDVLDHACAAVADLDGPLGDCTEVARRVHGGVEPHRILAVVRDVGDCHRDERRLVARLQCAHRLVWRPSHEDQLSADWEQVTTLKGVGSIAVIEPVGCPPATVWTGDRLVLGGQAGLVARQPATRRFTALTDRRIRTFGGTVVWTGTEVVSLVNQNSQGWTWTPPKGPGR
jgi:hypothetical protein